MVSGRATVNMVMTRFERLAAIDGARRGREVATEPAPGGKGQ
jgi:hypothetical protein